MGVKRDIDSGKKDSLGRIIKVSGASMANEENAAVRAQQLSDIDLDMTVDDVDFDEAMDILNGNENAPASLVDELSAKRENYISDLSTDDLRDIVYECNSWDGSLEEYNAEENSGETLEILCGGDFERLANMMYFGDYNPTHGYLRTDGYGNIKTLSESEYHDELDDNREEIYEMYEEVSKDAPQYVSDDYRWI